jgi:RNA polymerase sigma-70 factor (ECF subfamily)
MSAKRNPKEYIAPYELLSDWDEVLLGDEELFREMTEPHLPALLKAARKDIDCERRLGNLPSGLLQPEELVGETLIQAWETRHGRTERRPLREWLLEIQKHALKKAIEAEKKLHEPIILSLEEHVPMETESRDENEFWEWIEPPLPEQWADVIPDHDAQPLAAHG